jgi:hypothetical protein
MFKIAASRLPNLDNHDANLWKYAVATLKEIFNLIGQLVILGRYYNIATISKLHYYFNTLVFV